MILKTLVKLKYCESQLYRKKKRAASSTANRRTKFSHLHKMALEALYKDSKYPSHGVIEELAKLKNLDGATVKVWFNNKRQRDTGEPSEA